MAKLSWVYVTDGQNTVVTKGYPGALGWISTAMQDANDTGKLRRPRSEWIVSAGKPVRGN